MYLAPGGGLFASVCRVTPRTEVWEEEEIFPLDLSLYYPHPIGWIIKHVNRKILDKHARIQSPRWCRWSRSSQRYLTTSNVVATRQDDSTKNSRR